MTRASVVLSLLVGLTPILLLNSNQASALEPWEASGWSQISSGGTGLSVCALSNGNGYCWGANYNGQLGNDTLIHSNTPSAVDTSGVLAGKTLQSITVGSSHTCAIASDGQAYCWGYNGQGQLGNNSTTNSSIPVAVVTSGVLAGKTLQSITAGNGYTCAIASDNQAYCWGNNGQGQLGNNTLTNSSIPVAVVTSGVLAGKTLQSIATGDGHTCAIASDGQAYCWGYNLNGQLGNNSTTNTSIPVVVVTSGVLADKTLQSITVGNRHTCAIASDDRVYCWGFNGAGQLGNDSITDSYIPVAVVTSGVLAGKTLQSIAAGSSHTCAIASDNQAYCWGSDGLGQLGNSTLTDSYIPVAVVTSGVLAGKTLQSITAGNAHTCAITSDNQAYCWGYNWNGQLGNSSTTNSSIPVAVRGAIPLIISNVVFSNQDNRTVLTVTGTSFPDYTLGLSRSLMSLNGQALPFCTGGTGATAEEFVNDYGVNSANVSDIAPCYYLVDPIGSFPVFTQTNAQIWLPDTFDITAPGVVSVDGSPIFSFNQPVSSVPPSDPPVIVNPPEVVKIDSKETVSQATASRSPIVTSGEEDTSDSDSSAVSTVTIDGQVLGDHTTIDARPTFTGKAPAGSKVTVTVHSDPVTCSTIADREDNWSCTLAEALPDGDHTVRLAVVTPENEAYNYGPYDVTVGMSDTNSADTDQSKENSAVDSKSEMTFIPFIVGGAVLAVLIASIIIVKRLRH